MRESDNMIKLKELTAKLCDTSTYEYESVIVQLKKIIADGKIEIGNAKTQQSKLKSYEKMCSTINNILTNIKI